MGGTVEYPSYKQVSTGETGHVETVQIFFDPRVLSYEKLLKLFWELHNPTGLDHETDKVASQYRSVIFYHNDKQRDIAIQSKLEMQKSVRFGKEIITEILPATRFYKAKEYHQQLYEKIRFGGAHWKISYVFPGCDHRSWNKQDYRFVRILLFSHVHRYSWRVSLTMDRAVD